MQLKNSKQDFIWLGDIKISLPFNVKKPPWSLGRDMFWRHDVEDKIGIFYLRMGFERSKNRYYRIPRSNFYIRPIIIYAEAEDMHEALITLDHKIATYDSSFDMWSTCLSIETVLESLNHNQDIILFNLNLFSGPITFKWLEFPKVFEAYLI